MVLQPTEAHKHLGVCMILTDDFAAVVRGGGRSVARVGMDEYAE